MIHIAISCAGKLDKPYWQAAAQEYTKRLSAFCKLQVTEADDRAAPRFMEKHHGIALCIGGAELSSEELAAQLQLWQNTGLSRVCFYIGGSDGLPQSLIDKTQQTLSLSHMTWPHAVARVLLLEQLYRSFQILSGSAYHK